MSTLGFGDITFTSDIGKLFSIIVLVSGIILIMIVMPFTFIRFVYQPWIEEYNNKRKPRSLPSDTSGHTVLVGDNDISLSVARKLRQHNYPYVILVPDGQHAPTPTGTCGRTRRRWSQRSKGICGIRTSPPRCEKSRRRPCSPPVRRIRRP